jgi:hypothetical protein
MERHWNDWVKLGENRVKEDIAGMAKSAQRRSFGG